MAANPFTWSHPSNITALDQRHVKETLSQQLPLGLNTNLNLANDNNLIQIQINISVRADVCVIYDRISLYIWSADHSSPF